MKTIIFCGKGGVGKTNSAVSLGLHLARSGQKTAIVDFDGGHSVNGTLGIKGDIVPNCEFRVDDYLAVVVIENHNFVGIAECKEKKKSTQSYLKQFSQDQGILPLADMVNAFFGVPTDVAMLSRFVMLVSVLENLTTVGYDNVIIDVEPTAGLERLLINAKATARSLRNLKNQGRVSLVVLGAKWPDIAMYLKGEYIREADKYSERIERVTALIQGAIYFIVATPEFGPVKQTIEVRRIIERFGGKIHGYVFNNMRGEEHEEVNISLLNTGAVPSTRIPRRKELHQPGQNKITVLTAVGKKIADGLRL